jgi:hypothetical protein
LRSGDPRITTLSASDRALVLQRARASADALDSLGLPWLDTILTDVTAVLNGADG